MWIFAINGIAYAIYLAVSGEWRVLWPTITSFTEAIWVTLYDLHVPAARRRGLPAQGKYNGAQRIAYSAIVLMGAGSLLSAALVVLILKDAKASTAKPATPAARNPPPPPRPPKPEVQPRAGACHLEQGLVKKAPSSW